MRCDMVDGRSSKICDERSNLVAFPSPKTGYHLPNGSSGLRDIDPFLSQQTSSLSASLWLEVATLDAVLLMVRVGWGVGESGVEFNPSIRVQCRRLVNT